ncbi:Sec-independent protein translocase protein TatB [Roseobacter sp. HKCCA0434]|uniref:Sec-independent protein translocase protein TatB n=1 Tax=Roseobacter sp. HKCCA0434 TaxID=3079297 RepID=UPI0029059D9D|nr:Sec-independent protein translocase protein TatB [Roseobacter sp. HKCCA0434]
MFDIGFAEMMVIGVVALIVVGPKDLPRMFRTVGKFVGQARGMARQFQSAMNDAARQSELQDVKKAMDGVGQTMRSATNPIGEAAKSARKYSQDWMKDFEEKPEGERPARDPAEAAREAAAQAEEPHFDEMPDPEPVDAPREMDNSMMPPGADDRRRDED